MIRSLLCARSHASPAAPSGIVFADCSGVPPVGSGEGVPALDPLPPPPPHAVALSKAIATRVSLIPVLARSMIDVLICPCSRGRLVHAVPFDIVAIPTRRSVFALDP